jgi:Peptidase family M41
MTENALNDQTIPTNDLWKNFPGASALEAWVDEIKELIRTSNRNESAWALAGTAAVIEIPHAEDATLLIKTLSKAFGFSYELWLPGAREISACPQKDSGEPHLIYIPSDEWQQTAIHPELDPVTSEILARMASFNSTRPEIVVTTTTDYDDFSSVLRGPGAFSRAIRVNPPTAEQFGNLFAEAVGSHALSSEIKQTPTRIGRLLQPSHPSVTSIQLAALKVQRDLKRRAALVRWRDLIELALNGVIDCHASLTENTATQEAVAWHEAGHAVMAYIDSQGENIPEFTSIIPTTNYGGVMMDSVDFAHEAYERMSYCDFRHSIRVALAGRAAEEIAYGTQGISHGCSGDLANASHLARRAFSRWGFSPDMESEEQSSRNLYIGTEDSGKGTSDHIENMCRSFLEKQYHSVLESLKQNFQKLKNIKDALITESVIDAEGFLRNVELNYEIDGAVNYSSNIKARLNGNHPNYAN